ncbi:MAG: T9SS C-terminal target domain-containing protein [Bacteroidota bacterium]|jgi:hypothetical protein
MKRQFIYYTLLTMLITASAGAQLRDYRIHKRGMLHETIYNTGELGRAYDQGNGGSVPGVPSFEWPGNSGVIIDAVKYNGQYNSFGGGLQIAASPADTNGVIYSFCGGAGSSSPEVVVGKYSFPFSLDRKENYPLTTGGLPNANYDPDEAEEVITATWGTPGGLTVKRTSRAWSFPDYDDFIIYEYEITNTGNRDANPNTIESSADIYDAMIGFAYGFTPSMFGYERTFNRWNYADFESNDLRARFDRNRWLNYTIDRNGKPDPQYFAPWASDNRYGGGLLSPQAVGFLPLFYDTTHLAVRSDSRIPSTDSAIVWDVNGNVKQPFLNRLETSNMRIAKIQPYFDVSNSRKNAPYRNTSVYGSDWVGRGSFNTRQSKKFGVGRIMIFGPYTIRFGETVKFAIAQVAGYGAARLEQTRSGLKDEGGSCGELCSESADAPFFPVPNWSKDTTYGADNTTYGSNYLSSYSLPVYVNSSTVTIRDVADRAIEAYTGTPFIRHDTIPFWPEQSPDHGLYKLPVPLPSPIMKISNSALAENEIIWGTGVENFTSPRLVGSLRYYEVYKANHPLGPWTRLDSIAIGDPRYFAGGEYTFKDADTRVGESFYYSLVSVDIHGNRSARTNVALHQTQIGGTEDLEPVYVVPNPFIVRSGFAGTTAGGNDANDKLGFYNLPKHCIIRIFSYSGQLVQTIHHDTELYSTEWLQVTRNNQVSASGVYFYVVETPGGKRNHGKFVIIQ